MLVWDMIGAIIITYGVSRVTLALSRALLRGRSLSQVGVAHTLSWVLIAVALGLLRSNAYYPFAVDAGLIYVLPQILWFFFDYGRLEPGVGRSSRRAEQQSVMERPTQEIG